jgi:excinuclease ABC subunit C
MVCFTNGAPNKKEYRRYHVKTVKGINDFASMQEVVYRRYKRLLEEQSSLPQLIIIDGGKGQLSAAMESIRNLSKQMIHQQNDPFKYTTIVGLAKNEEEIFFPGDTDSIKLEWNSESLKLIRRIRDEVHNHGINFHRNLRSKGTFKNELENIPGIGKSTAALLLKTFKSVNNVKVAEENDLLALVGPKRTKLIMAYFDGKTLDSASELQPNPSFINDLKK